MSYEIKTYTENFLEKQVEIGEEIINKWLFHGQTTLENLKQTYSNENFDPSTRFYAFKDNEMVGFLTSAVQPKEEDKPLTARLEFPIVLEPHREQVENLLLEKAYETLKGKGVERVLTRVSPLWGNTTDLAQKYNYKAESVQTMGSRTSIENLSFEIDPTLEFLDYEPERDDEALIKMYTEKLGLTEDFIKNQLKFINDNKELLLSWKIAKDGDEIVASSLAILFQNDKTQAQFTVPYAKDNKEKYTKAIFAHHLAAAKEKGATDVNVFLPQSRFDEEGFFDEIGFKFKKIKMYEKQL